MELTAQEVDNSVSSAAKIRKISDATKFSSKIMTKHENIAIQNVHYCIDIGQGRTLWGGQPKLGSFTFWWSFRYYCAIKITFYKIAEFLKTDFNYWHGGRK